MTLEIKITRSKFGHLNLVSYNLSLLMQNEDELIKKGLLDFLGVKLEPQKLFKSWFIDPTSINNFLNYLNKNSSMEKKIIYKIDKKDVEDFVTKQIVTYVTILKVTF